MPTDFDQQSYWHDRFTTETAFEWLLPSATFMAILEPLLAQLPSSAQILHLGSGTSDLHTHLRRRGFTHVTNIDYEPLAVERGRALEEQAFGDVQMCYVVQDATQLSLGRQEFDLVIDKSTSDAVSCAGDEMVRRMTEGVCAVLAEGGVWVSLSYSSARFDIEDLLLDLEVLARVPTPKVKETDPDIWHWCYLLRPKRGRETEVGAGADRV